MEKSDGKRVLLKINLRRKKAKGAILKSFKGGARGANDDGTD